MIKTYNDFVVKASGHVLSECLPDNWAWMNEQEFDDFLIDNVCEAYQNRSASGIWELIDLITTDFLEIYDEGLKENNNG